MTSEPAFRKSYRPEAKRWYDERVHVGLEDANAFIYSWHEEGDPDFCKIGHCTGDPFKYLWDESLPQQRRLPVVFLTIGMPSKQRAKTLERNLHRRFHMHRLDRAASREWFSVSKDELVSYVCVNENALVNGSAP